MYENYNITFVPLLSSTSKILGPKGIVFLFRLTHNVTTFPARLSASTAVE